ncbi:hypothetical protein J6590_105289, partial [Homalodisca vitripennis]
MDIPMGLFSHEGVPLDCIFRESLRTFVNLLSPTITKNLTLLPHQVAIRDRINETVTRIIEKNKSCVYITLCGDCSIGKTVITIDFLLDLGLKAFVITHSLKMAEQWKEQINKFAQNAKVFNSTKGACYVTKEVMTEYDFLCFPDKHLNNPRFVDLLSEHFSVGVVDECHLHNLSNQNLLSSFLLKNVFSYMISLTATPRQENRLFLGPLILTGDIERLVTFRKIFTEVSCNTREFYNPQYIEYVRSYRRLSKTDKYTLETALSIDNLKKRILSTDQNRVRTIVKKCRSLRGI